MYTSTLRPLQTQSFYSGNMATKTALNQIIEREAILLDNDLFRSHLQFQTNLFEQFKTQNDLSQILRTENDPSENDKLPPGAILSSANGIGQLAFTMLIIVRYTGWTPGSLTMLKAGEFDSTTITNDPASLSLNNCPIKTNSLLETIAWLLLEFLIFPCLKIAYADSEFSSVERRLIINLFSKEWGYNPEFVDQFISHIEPELEHFSYRRYTDNLKKICQFFPEINYEETRDELKHVIRKVIDADSTIHPNEQQQLDQFFEYLALEEEQRDKPTFVSSLWHNIFKGEDDRKDASIVEILKKIPLFEHLTRRELRTVSKLVYQRTYHPDEQIFQINQPGAAMFIVKKGNINIVLPGADNTETLLAKLGPGTFFGELALLDNSPRSATAKATENTEAIAFFRSEFNRLLNMYPSIGIKVMKKLALIIGQRLKATNEQLSASR